MGECDAASFFFCRRIDMRSFFFFFFFLSISLHCTINEEGLDAVEEAGRQAGRLSWPACGVCRLAYIQASQVACVNEWQTSGRISPSFFISCFPVCFLNPGAVFQGAVPPKRAHYGEADRSMLAQQKRWNISR